VSGATFSQSTTTADCKTLALDTNACKRYIRYVGTIVTGPQNVAVQLAGVPKNA
jgi:hypothetical protein